LLLLFKKNYNSSYLCKIQSKTKEIKVMKILLLQK